MPSGCIAVRRLLLVYARTSNTFGETFARAVSQFGATATDKLRGPGQREAKIRGPLEQLLREVADSMHLKLIPYDETPLSGAHGRRPDYAVSVNGLLIGYVELKAPETEIDPSHWSRKGHDYQQWEQFRELPNILYTNGNQWAIYQAGQQIGSIARVEGDVRASGPQLAAANEELLHVLVGFLHWMPKTPRNLKQLVKNVAGLCRLLRDEVRLTLRNEREGDNTTNLSALVADWRRLLFPNLDDDEFADAYAQTVTFALLLARVESIAFEGRTVEEIAYFLGKSHSLMGKALAALTENWALGERAITVKMLVRVIGAVDWDRFDDKTGEAYLRLYEQFLSVYDSDLRKKTGSYYTPPEIVDFMVAFVDEVLRVKLHLKDGLGSTGLLILDPAMGTGTFLIKIIEHIAEATRRDGEVDKARLRELASRLVGFEKQACPYAVAELRVAEAMHQYDTDPPQEGMALRLVDTLDPFTNAPRLDGFGDPPVERQRGAWYEPIERSHREANTIKEFGRVQVAIGNPPYLAHAKGLGGWVETSKVGASRSEAPSLDSFRARGRERFEHKLRNLYVYFWRWATWKVFEAHSDAPTGIVAFITVSSYAKGEGFAGMRAYLREVADEGWIIDLSPEGHRPPMPTRVFPHVKQPLCIGVFARYGPPSPNVAAVVHYASVDGRRSDKLDRLARLTLDASQWTTCSFDREAPFTPSADNEWISFPSIVDLFPWSSPGVKPNRSWVYSPDSQILRKRWRKLVKASPDHKARMLKQTNDRTIDKAIKPTPGFDSRQLAFGEKLPPLRDEADPCPTPTRIGFRSFDRQWLIPDSRVVDRPREGLWRIRGDHQIYMTEPRTEPVTGGPALTFTADPPDQHHYNNRGGRAVPLYRDAGAEANITPKLIPYLANRLAISITPEDFLAYVAAVAAHPAFTRRFTRQLNGTGVRVPLTADSAIFQAAKDIGSRVIWLHTYGQRCFNDAQNRPFGPPQLPDHRRSPVPRAIPHSEAEMPEDTSYDRATETIHIGSGQIQPVSPAVWEYKISGWHVLTRWFGYRLGDPTAPDPTELDYDRPNYWTADATDELLQLLHVLTLIVDLEPDQAELLDRISAAPLITVEDLRAAGVLPAPPSAKRLVLLHDTQAALFRTTGK